jgi:hypothetical protein
MTKKLLEWSDLLKSFPFEEEEDIQLTDVENYLFVTQTHVFEFVVIDEEMAQLNDYCLLLLNATSQKLTELKTDLKDYKSGKKNAYHSTMGDLTADQIMVLEDFEIPAWEDTYSFVAVATCLLLIQAFIEKNLKFLFVSLSGENKKQRQKPGESKIDAYLRGLREDCGIKFDESNELKQLRKEIESLRNAFAHGDWDKVRNTTAEIDLMDVFQMATDIFSNIEAGYTSET